MMYTRSSGNRVGGIASASRFLLFFLLQWSWGGWNSYSLTIECPTNCGSLSNIRFPFGTNPLCGAPGFVLDCSSVFASASASASTTPLWNPLDDLGPSLNRTFAVLEIHVDPNSLSKGSALVSLTAFPAPPSCSNNSSNSNKSYSGINPPYFNFSSAVDKLTTSGQNWTISQHTSFLFAGCSVDQFNITRNLSVRNVPCDSYNIRTCAFGQLFCFVMTDRKSARSFAAGYNCGYFTSFVQNGPAARDQPVLEIKWSMDQDLAKQCYSCLHVNQSCIINDGTDSGKVRCAECKGSTCFSLSPGPAPAPAPDASPRESKSRQRMIGIAGGMLGTLMLLFLLIFWARECILKYQVSRNVQLQHSFHNKSNIVGSFSSSSNNTKSKKRFQALVEQAGPISTTVYRYEELRHATGAFSDDKLLGDGGFGSVYEGRLYSGQRVAVKRLYHNSHRRVEQFVNEIRILSSLDHPNLIKLYGFCYHEEPRDLLLVCEFAPHGTLSDHLHGGEREAKRLTWPMRLRVALETAMALQYLHSAVKPPIFHRDVKSANILLDENFHAKLADFGLSRMAPLHGSHLSTAPQGTPGYVDPDYHQCYQLTDKSDVYSFGVVLMEIVSGKAAVDASREKGEVNLSQLALSMIQKGAIEELIDPHLNIERCPVVRDMVCGVAEMAFQCLAAEKDDRPTMNQVVAELARIQRIGPWTMCTTIPGVNPLLHRNNSLEDISVAENEQQQKHPSKEGELTPPLSPSSIQSHPWNSWEPLSNSK